MTDISVGVDSKMTSKERTARALELKAKMKSNFFKKGIAIALFSGVSYGFYTAFLTMGMSKGVWADWYGANKAGLSTFVIVYLLAALGNAINDSCSAVWAIGNSLVQGKFKDFLRCLNSKPGRTIIVAALLGGPIAGTAYVVALQMAGPIIVPISALCPAIAAILGKILYKQEITKRMSDGFILGILIAIIAALGWGFEGCVAGYASTMVDPQIGICIRQLSSGIANLFIVVPIMGVMAGGIGISNKLVIEAFTSGPAMIWFVLSGLLTFLTFMTWYKGNSMCGAGLGTACNGTYSFFGPFACYLILGVAAGMEGWTIPAIAWVGAIIMMFGILTIAMNPLDLFRKKEA